MSDEPVSKSDPSQARSVSSYQPTPKEEMSFLLKGIEETAKQARSLLVVLSTASAFVLIAAFSQDAEKSIKLPIIGNEIDPGAFFIWSPLVLLSMYLYLQFYIQELRGRFARLRDFHSRMQIRQSLRRDIVFPWFFVTALEAQSASENKNDQDQYAQSAPAENYSVPFLYQLSVFIVWIMGPVVLAILWLLFLRQGKSIALVPCASFVAAAIVAIRSLKSAISKPLNALLAICSAFVVSLTLASVPSLRHETYLDYLWQARHAVMQWTDKALLPFAGKASLIVVPLSTVGVVLKAFFDWLWPLRIYRRSTARELRSLTTTSGLNIQSVYSPTYGALRNDPKKEVLLSTAVADYAKLLIVGAPGTGKTTAMTRLALELAEGERRGVRLAPVFIRLRRIRSEVSLLDIVTDAFSAANIGRPRFLVRKLAELGRLALLLDGFDELSPEESRRVQEEMQSLMEQYPQCVYITSSRSIGFRDQLEKAFDGIFEIAPMSSAAVDMMVRKYFGHNEQVAETFLRKYRESFHNDFRTPLMLTTMLNIFSAHGYLPDSPEEQIRLLVDSRLTAIRATASNPRESSEFLRLLAVNLQRKQSPLLDRHEAVQLAATMMESFGDIRQPDEMIEDVMKTGLLAYENDSLGFAHKAIQEYFIRES